MVALSRQLLFHFSRAIAALGHLLPNGLLQVMSGLNFKFDRGEHADFRLNGAVTQQNKSFFASCKNIFFEDGSVSKPKYSGS